MKEILTRSLSGLLYITILISSLVNIHVLTFVFYIFGLICLTEFNKLIQFKNILIYLIFTILYFCLGYRSLVFYSKIISEQVIFILLTISILVHTLLILDLLINKKKIIFIKNKFVLSIFYLSTSFVFLILTANFDGVFSPKIILGIFVLIWMNDSFAYLIGKNFGRIKLFSQVSPKKTFEGFIGGMFFTCISSYFIAIFTEILSFGNWLVLAVLISTVGTLGDLIESKYKRAAHVKDSGAIMPGHGGLLDRFDSIIFAIPFIYLFLSISQYVS